MFLGFLFLVPEEGQLTSAKCRDDALAEVRKENPSARTVANFEVTSANYLPVEVVTYSVQDGHGKTIYSARGFTATKDICGDLEFYSNTPIGPEDPEIKKILATFHLDIRYTPQFGDAFLYAQILYRRNDFKAAAPIFELALSKIGDGKDQQTMRRVTTDQAGMAYGISGDIAKARALFEAAIAKDPDYPLYYYNLACADAQEGKLTDARSHLQEAFTRKANVIPGETLPDPSTDNSFTPYRSNEEFWKFVSSLH